MKDKQIYVQTDMKTAKELGLLPNVIKSVDQLKDTDMVAITMEWGTVKRNYTAYSDYIGNKPSNQHRKNKLNSLGKKPSLPIIKSAIKSLLKTKKPSWGTATVNSSEVCNYLRTKGYTGLGGQALSKDMKTLVDNNEISILNKTGNTYNYFIP